jgi:hypothetical protein
MKKTELYKQKIKKRKIKAGTPTDTKPTSALHCTITINRRGVSINDYIDKQIKNLLKNKDPGENSEITNAEFKIVNQQDEVLMEGPNVKPTLFSSFYWSEPIVRFLFEIPIYKSKDENFITATCTDLTHMHLVEKMDTIIRKYQNEDIKAKIMIYKNHHIAKYIFLHNTHMIYAEIDVTPFKPTHNEVNMYIHYVLPAVWNDFFMQEIMRSPFKNNKWMNVYDSMQNQLRFEAVHRLAKSKYKSKTKSSEKSPKSPKYTLQSLPVELIDMAFDFLNKDELSNNDIGSIIAIYKDIYT